MATYLQLCNNVLSRVNEVQITSVAAGANTSIQDYVTRAVLDAIDDINNTELEWPFNVQSGSQTLTPGQRLYSLPTGYTSVDWESFFLKPADLVTNGAFTSNITNWSNLSTATGTIAHISSGNGRLQLNGGAAGVGIAEQSIATVATQTYRIIVRYFDGAINLRIGSTSGGSEIYTSKSMGTVNAGGWNFFTVTFVATTANTFIDFLNSANENRAVDLVQVFREIQEEKLEYMELDRYNRLYSVQDSYAQPSEYSKPLFVFATKDDGFGVTPVPNDDYLVTYTYWKQADRMTVNSDISPIPVRFHHVIEDRALYYLYLFRENSDGAILINQNYEKNLKHMRIELINKSDRIVGREYFRKSTHLPLIFSGM